MSKASDYAKAMAHPQPRLTIGEQWHGKSAVVDERGNLSVEYSQPNHDMLENPPAPTRVVIGKEDVPRLIKWLQDTFLE